ncbi:7359_t:CDS:2, partial [Paraglomus occultum]
MLRGTFTTLTPFTKNPSLLTYFFKSDTGVFKRGYVSSKKTRIKKDPQGLPFEEAVAVLKSIEVGRHDNTFELHIRTRRDKSQLPIRGSVSLPKSFAKEVAVLVFTTGDKVEEAKAAGAHTVGGMEFIEEIKKGSVNLDQFNKALATPDLLPALLPIARILGPKQLMPTVKKGTVTDDIGAAVIEALGKFEFKADKHGVVHAPIGKMTFTAPELQENVTTVVRAIEAIGKDTSKKPKSVIERIVLNSTQGPGICLIDIMSIIEAQDMAAKELG